MVREILLVDDHEIIRRGVRELLEDHLDKDVVLTEVGSCAQLEQYLEKKLPDLLLLDLELGDGNAVDMIAEMHQRFPSMRILVFSMGPEQVFAPRVDQLGGCGFVSKSVPVGEMVRAVRKVLAGGKYVSHAEEMRRLDVRRGSAFAALSERELMVMRELLQGAGVVEIAQRSGVKPNTITTYKARLFDKLGVTNILQLQRLAQLNGW